MERLTEPDFITGRNGVRRPSRAGDSTARRDGQIIRLRNQGLTMRAIAAETGWSLWTVNAVLKRAREAAA